MEAWLSPTVFRANRPDMLVVDRSDLKICRMSYTEREGDISVIHLHYLITTREGIRRAEEVHRLALFSTAHMVSYFQAAGLRSEFDPEGISRRGLFLARPA